MKQKTVATPLAAEPKHRNRIWVRLRRDWQLHLMLLLPVIYLLIFKYYPMYGAQIAFRDYSARKGIWGSAFVGMKWFEKFWNNPFFWDYVKNTISLSLYTILASFPVPVALALLINVIRNQHFKKLTQTVSYIPHFISVVVLVALLNQVLSPVNGIYGNFYRLAGGEGYPTDLRNSASAFRHLYVWSGVWQNCGWNTIVYLAALSAVSAEQHEAAMIDGASRWARIIHVDLPAILPTVSIMLILRFGSVMSIGFEKVFLMQNALNMKTSEVISTYVYKAGIKGLAFSFGTAVDLFNSVINCVMLLLVNKITKWISRSEVSLF